MCVKSKDIYVLKQIRTPDYFDYMQINTNDKNCIYLHYHIMLCKSVFEESNDNKLKPSSDTTFNVGSKLEASKTCLLVLVLV